MPYQIWYPPPNACILLDVDEWGFLRQQGLALRAHAALDRSQITTESRYWFRPRAPCRPSRCRADSILLYELNFPAVFLLLGTCFWRVHPLRHGPTALSRKPFPAERQIFT